MTFSDCSGVNSYAGEASLLRISMRCRTAFVRGPASLRNFSEGASSLTGSGFSTDTGLPYIHIFTSLSRRHWRERYLAFMQRAVKGREQKILHSYTFKNAIDGVCANAYMSNMQMVDPQDIELAAKA